MNSPKKMGKLYTVYINYDGYEYDVQAQGKGQVNDSRRKFPAKKPRDMLKLGSGANTGLPKYFLILLAKTNV